jgi:hypothetical protein
MSLVRTRQRAWLRFLGRTEVLTAAGRNGRSRRLGDDHLTDPLQILMWDEVPHR